MSKFTLKLTDDDGKVILDIVDRELNVDNLLEFIPAFMNEMSMAIGEDILPHMEMGVALAELLHNPFPIIFAPVAEQADAADLKSVD